MDVQAVKNYFVIFREREDRMQYFSFFVDGDKSSWSKNLWSACEFDTRKQAQEFIEHIKRRERERRASRKQNRN